MDDREEDGDDDEDDDVDVADGEGGGAAAEDAGEVAVEDNVSLYAFFSSFFKFFFF